MAIAGTHRYQKIFLESTGLLFGTDQINYCRTDKMPVCNRYNCSNKNISSSTGAISVQLYLLANKLQKIITITIKKSFCCRAKMSG